MNQPQEPQIPPNKNTSMRAFGEQDRSPEHKDARDHYASKINEVVNRIKAMQEAGETLTLPNGQEIPIEEEPKMTATYIGRNQKGFRSYASSMSPGASLTGDGETSPISFQAFLPFSNGEVTIIEMTGTNPLLPRDDNGNLTYKSRSDGNVASLKVTRKIPTEDSIEEIVESYTVLGDGTMGGPPRSIGESTPDKPTSYDQRAIDTATVACMVVSELEQSLKIK